MIVYKFKYSSGICKRLFHYPSPLLKKRKTKFDPQIEDHKNFPLSEVINTVESQTGMKD